MYEEKDQKKESCSAAGHYDFLLEFELKSSHCGPYNFLLDIELKSSHHGPYNSLLDLELRFPTGP
jgi:hypothetical protein